MKIERVAQPEGLPGFLQVEMADLRQSMYARIRTPSAANPDTRAGSFQYCVLEVVLHSAAVGLRLPANKRRSIVFDRYSVSWHVGILRRVQLVLPMPILSPSPSQRQRV